MPTTEDFARVAYKFASHMALPAPKPGVDFDALPTSERELWTEFARKVERELDEIGYVDFLYQQHAAEQVIVPPVGEKPKNEAEETEDPKPSGSSGA